MRLFFFLLFQVSFLVNASPLQDSALLAASYRYKTNFAIRKLLVGNNYRKTWETAVKMPVFDISKEKGGFIIKKLGGGAQTKSLRLQDKEGIEWVLRTVDKDVKKLMPPVLKGSVINMIVQDLISTAHPYAPLVVAPLAKALDLNAPWPQLFFVPNDSAFKEFRNYFANSVCMLEKLSLTDDEENGVSTDTLFKTLEDNNNNNISDTTFLKARLLDMLIADWDRHKGQLKWGVKRNGESNTYYPVVRDRDQAFFYSDGLILLQTRWVVLKNLTNFIKSDRWLTRLSKRSWGIDKALLNKLDEDDWRRVIMEFQQSLNDSVLLMAVKNMPPEIYEQDGTRIYEILKARRNGLLKHGMKYYNFISKKMILTGSKRDEKVNIKKAGRLVEVTMYDKVSGRLLYKRKINPQKTQQLSILLLGGNDELEIDYSIDHLFKIMLDAGEGKDDITIPAKFTITADKQTRAEIKGL